MAEQAKLPIPAFPAMAHTKNQTRQANTKWAEEMTVEKEAAREKKQGVSQNNDIAHSHFEVLNANIDR